MRLTGARDEQRLIVEVLDADGRTVAGSYTTIDAGQLQVADELTVLSPRLWNGRADPYLYRLVATLEEDSLNARTIGGYAVGFHDGGVSILIPG